MFQQQLKAFFQDVGSLHATNILRDIPNVLPLMKRYPEIAAKEIHRFKRYLISSPSHNHLATFQALNLIAQHVPALREQIIFDLGDVLYEYKTIAQEAPYGALIDSLLSTLQLPITTQDQQIRDLARAVVTLKQPIILIIGAGFSYDTMPITNELRSLLLGVLKYAGIKDPLPMLEKNEDELWRIIKNNSHEFKSRFAGWCAHSKPSVQHRMITQMLRTGQISHLISFNWDDLCERTYFDSFGVPVIKIVNDHDEPNEPALWKLHGDVENIEGEWVFPNDPGRVFDSLISSLELASHSKLPSHAIIIGYRESEPIVKDRLISWIERNIPNILRIRPDWPESQTGGIRDSAKRFAQRLQIYLEIEQRSHL